MSERGCLGLAGVCAGGWVGGMLVRDVVSVGGVRIWVLVSGRVWVLWLVLVCEVRAW